MKASDNKSNEGFNVMPAEVAAHEGSGIGNQLMIRHRVQPCNGRQRQRTITDQLRAVGASSGGFSVEPLQVGWVQADLDFLHGQVRA